MAVTVPIIFTPITDAEVKYQRSTQEDTIKKMVQNVNMFGKLAPIGTIRCIQLNQVGVQAPDSNIWQICDGSEITNPNSPLRTMGLTQRFTPDMRSRYVRGAPSAVSNGVGGSPTIDLSHAHSGSTGPSGGATRGEEGTEKTARVNHSHPINSDLSATEPLDPAHQVLAFYIKIT